MKEATPAMVSFAVLAAAAAKCTEDFAVTLTVDAAAEASLADDFAVSLKVSLATAANFADDAVVSFADNVAAPTRVSAEDLAICERVCDVLLLRSFDENCRDSAFFTSTDDFIGV